MNKTFDLVRFLDDKSIPYYTEGKNVSAGWIGIQCPFCGDSSNHLGIHEYSKSFSCFRCGETGGLLKLIRKLLNCSHNAAESLVRAYQDINSLQTAPPLKQTSDSITLPTGLKQPLPEMHRKYLEKRNYDPSQIEKMYGVGGCGFVGDFKFRLIIPVYQQYELVSFLGRDITGRADLRYKAAPISKSKIPLKHTLYNIDMVKDEAVVVEGVMDAWRIGRGAVATYGTKYTKEQLCLLNGLKRVFVMLDSDAEMQANKLAHDIAPFVRSVEILKLSKGDPGDLSESEVYDLRKDLRL